MITKTKPALHLKDDALVGPFQAMGCACEILLDTRDTDLAESLMVLGQREVERIEAKYSRYRSGNVVDQINSSHGRKITVDEETAALLDYADNNYCLSEGLFDVTSGVLRRAWTFDGREIKGPPPQLEQLRSRIGWNRVLWKRPALQMLDGFELDFGGIAKEYAADRILALLKRSASVSILVNLGGDLAAGGTRRWSIGIEDATALGRISKTISLSQGGVATSGSTKRFVTINGDVYGHVLNPKTGWPVKQAPRSVTVAAATCTEAGFWSTLAMLQGEHAKPFLEKQSLEFWCDA